MTIDEQRLAEWLHETTPEPPRGIDIANVAARTTTRRRTWLPALAAVCVIALVAGLILALRASHDSTQPAAPSATSSSSARPSANPTLRATTCCPPAPKHIALAAHPWHAAALGATQLEDNTLIAIDDHLYAMSFVATTRLVRLDPATGAVVARSPALSDSDFLPPVAAAGLVWAVRSHAGDRVTVQGFDPGTLAPRKSIAVALVGSHAQRSVLVPGAAPDTLLVGGGTQLALLDARTKAMLHRFGVDGTVGGLAESPDRTTLYVAVTSRTSARIETRDSSTGLEISAGPNYDPGGYGGLVATTGGLWSTYYGGHIAGISFAAIDGRRPRGNVVAGGSGGGLYANVSISDGIAWLGGYQVLGCADPDTGDLSAHVKIHARSAMTPNFTGFTVLDHRTYALATAGPGSVLVVLHPPAACGVR